MTTEFLTPPGTRHDSLNHSDPVTAAETTLQTGPATALVEIAIPVYNEQDVLESSIRRLRDYLDQSFPFTAAIVIVDNASLDGTWEIASHLCLELEGVSAIHLDQKGRGRAIRAAWTSSRSEVVAYMDVDLSTDLDGLLPLVAPLLSGHSQVAIGSRIATGSRVLRGGKRELISRCYNLILRTTLRAHFSDAQCGFKAMRRESVDRLLESIEDEAWFFDTELLIQAERRGLRIHEVAVDWIDDPDTRVQIVSTASEDLRGVWRLVRDRSDCSRPTPADPVEVDGSAFESLHQLARYASVGIVSSIAYLTIFLLLSESLGMFAANLVAAATTATANTLAHAWFTFRARRGGEIRQAIVLGMFSFAVGIGLTSVALAMTYAFGRTSTLAEAIAILVGIIAAACLRFVLLREWAFRNHRRGVLSSRLENSATGDGSIAGAAPHAA